MEIFLYRTSEPKMLLLGTTFQNLHCNYDYTEQRNITMRVLETAFQSLQWNYANIEIPKVQFVFLKLPFRNCYGATSK
jgi:hypothetical protein